MFKTTRILFISLLCFIQPCWAWEQNNDNLWDVIRADFQLQPNNQDPAVQAEIDFFRNHRKLFNRIALSAVPYLYYIHNEVRRMGLPGEVSLIPMIESAYNPRAYSKAGAAGLWQLMPGTGSGLGLEINYWYDARRDVVTSTQAALNYFKKLNRLFAGDWLLSIAAYDSGEGAVQRAVQANTYQNRNADFWSLSLPRETQRYVPKLLAVVEIIKNPQHYAIELPYIPNKPYFSHVELNDQIDLNTAAEIAKLDLDHLYRLNPGFNRWTTGPGHHILLLPVEQARLFAAHIQNHVQQQTSAYHTHHVKKGEKLATIAARYQLTAEELKQLNHLASNHVRAGTSLKISRASLNEETIAARHKVLLAYQTENIGPHRVSYLVRVQDSIDSIAARYHVKANAIRFWNHIRADQTIQSGNILTIWTTLPASKILSDNSFIQQQNKPVVKYHRHKHLA